MGSTKDFFKNKKGWSIFKDEIIGYYLVPYISKILSTNRPLFLIDCFAGKGKFDSGEDGSPLIIAKQIEAILVDESRPNRDIYGIFIENKYNEDLSKNLSDFKNCTVCSGNFEEQVDTILELSPKCNIFLYVDPYGPKSIPYEPFSRIKTKGFSSCELLINFNSIGFLREGSALLKLSHSFEDMDENSEDYEEMDDIENLERWDDIANGDYWQEILKKKNAGVLNKFEAEELFINEYCKQIKKLFKYVINIPILEKTPNLPKYRLIFGTDHVDGLILMVNRMNKVWNKILLEERMNQNVLFEYIFPDMSVIKKYDLEEDIISLIKSKGNAILLQDLLSSLIEKYGITFSQKEYNDKIKKMEGKKILIERKPENTPTGRKALSMDYSKFNITLRLI